MSTFLADECFPIDSIKLLSESGYVVRRYSPGAPDADVLEECRSRGYVLLTMDVADFGELMYADPTAPKASFASGFGVVIFRLQSRDPSIPGHYLVRLLRQENVLFQGFFTSISDGPVVRQRVL